MSVSSGNNGLWKPLIAGVLTAAVITAVLLCLTAVAFGMIPTVPYGIIGYLTIAFSGIGVLIGAYIASAIAKSRGLIIGLLTAAVILIVLIAVGLSIKENDVSVMTAIRAAVLLICGALGGVKGVNRKEHIHIK